MRWASETFSYFISWSGDGWLQTASRHLDALEDLETLSRIGFHMEWAREPPSGQLEYEKASTEKLFSFLKSLLKFRAGSNLCVEDGEAAVGFQKIHRCDLKAFLVCADYQGPGHLHAAAISAKS